MTHTHTQRERERAKPKQKSPKLWLGIILGTVALAGVGTTIYLVNRSKSTETKTQTAQEKIQQFQQQLSQLQSHSNTLNQTIARTEADLQTKRTEQTQNSSPNLQSEITQLEQQLATYKVQKQKLEAIIPKLEQQISNLTKGGSNSELKQEQIISQLAQEIKELNQELGIKEVPEEKKPDNPKENPKSPNLPKTPDFLNSTLQDLLNDLKTVHDYLTEAIPQTESNPPPASDVLARQKWQMELDGFKNGLQEVKQLQDKFTASVSPDQQEVIKVRTEIRKKWEWAFKDGQLPEDKPNRTPNQTPNNSQNIQTFQTLQGQVKELKTEIEKINRDYQEVSDKYNALPQETQNFAEEMFKDYFSVKSYIQDLTPLNLGKLEEYGSDSDYQIFLTASPETQKANLELFEANFNPILRVVKESLENIFSKLEKTVKWGEDWIEEMKKNGASPLIYSEAQLQVGKQRVAIIWKNDRFQTFDQKTIAEKIKAIQEVYQELERIDWKNAGNN